MLFRKQAQLPPTQKMLGVRVEINMLKN